MSENIRTICNAYYTGIGTLMASGETFEYIKERHILHPQDTLFIDFSATTPFILIYPNDWSPVVDVMSGDVTSDFNSYSITLSAFVRYPNATYGFLGNSTIKGTSQIFADIKSTYNNNTLSGSSLASQLTNVSFRRLGIEPLNEYHQVHCTFEHLWIDRG